MPPASQQEPPRLIDLRIDWLSQYAPESNIFGPETIARANRGIPRVEGYLGATSASFLMLGRDPENWAQRGDPWASLAELLARCEAEFPGRLLIGRDDLDRWRDDPDGLTWGVLGVGGFDRLVRSTADLERLPGLFARGVRVFQIVGTAGNELAGSWFEGDDRGLTDLGRAFLDAVASLGTDPRPIVDLAGLGPVALREVLDWLESRGSDRLLVMRSHGPIVVDDIVRLAALGGIVGLGASSRSFATAAELKDAYEAIASRFGFLGIGLATDALGDALGLGGLQTAGEIREWTRSNFPAEVARAILHDNVAGLIARSVGGLAAERTA